MIPVSVSVRPGDGDGSEQIKGGTVQLSSCRQVCTFVTRSGMRREVDIGPEGVVPEGVVPEGVVPEGVVPEGVVPEGVVNVPVDALSTLQIKPPENSDKDFEFTVTATAFENSKGRG